MYWNPNPMPHEFLVQAPESVERIPHFFKIRGRISANSELFILAHYLSENSRRVKWE
jgi:hypothetical protein